MKKEVIRDFYGRIIGWLETDNKGNQIARDFYNIILGRYDVRRNITSDFYGRILGTGNHLLGLIYESDRKYKEKKKSNR